MPSRREFTGRPAIRKVEELEVPNTPEVKPQKKVTNAELHEAIQMLRQAMNNQVRQQRGA